MGRVLVALLLVGCHPTTTGSIVDAGVHGDGGVDPIAGLTALVIAPASADLAAANGAPATQAFTATGTFQDGHDEDVTARVGWSLADPALGVVEAGQFTSAAGRGGATTVTAAAGAVSATAQVSVKLQSSRVSSDDGSTAPADSAMRFANPDNTPGLAPPLAYPLDGAFVPPNLGELEVQWLRPAMPADLFEVSIEGPYVDLKVYTNALVANGGRLSLHPDEWSAIAGASAGQPLTVAVRAMAAADPSHIGASSQAHLTVGRDAVNGGIYYWSATGGAATEGIFRHTFGDVSSPAKPFVTQADGPALFNDGQQHCVACHALSRDGKRMAVTFNGGDGPAGVIDVASKGAILPPSKAPPWNFSTFSPDGTRLAVAKAGQLSILDPTTGATIAKVPASGYATHPDWSPDGKKLAFVHPGAAGSDWDFSAGSIVVATDGGAGFDAGQVIVQSQGENNYYPSFSPDGQWIIFSRAAGGSAYDNGAAQSMVVSTDGKIGPIALAAANAVGALTDSWPRWSPFVQTNGPHGPLLYFTFSSKRAYGIELPGGGRPQIWMAAFDPATASAGQDPSFAPFWLPFQDLQTSNHIAQWTTEIVGVQ